MRTLSATRRGSPASSAGGLAGVDLAEVAAARALVAADEEGGLAVLPALEDVRAAGRLADGVQTFVLHELLDLLVLGAGAQLGLDPRRLALDRGLGVAGLDAQQLAALGCDGHRGSHHRAGERGQVPLQDRQHVGDGDGREPAPLAFDRERGDAGVDDPAGDDHVVGVEGVVDVERESVHRDAPRDADADRTDLAVRTVLVSRHPDAATSVDPDGRRRRGRRRRRSAPARRGARRRRRRSGRAAA